MSWQDGVLGDLVVLQRGHDLPESARKPGAVPVVGSAGPNGFHNIVKANGPGVTVGRSGASIGKVTYVGEDYWPHNTCLYVKDFKGNNPRFVAYFLSLQNLAQLNSGAAQPSLNRNFVYGVKARFPCPHEQAAIASILSTYDNLIENNRRRIALLEEAARQLYKEWFVRFRYPGHEHVPIVDGVPEGWEKKKLFDLSTSTYGFAFKSTAFSEEEVGLPVVRIRDVPNGASATYTPEESSEDKIIYNGDFLIGMDGDFHINFWSGGKSWLNQRVVRIAGGTDCSTGFLRYAIEKQIQNFNKTISGTTVKHLGAKHLKSIALILPPKALMNQINAVFETTRQQITTLAIQSRALGRARDLLLPKLMNGEIVV